MPSTYLVDGPLERPRGPNHFVRWASDSRGSGSHRPRLVWGLQWIFYKQIAIHCNPFITVRIKLSFYSGKGKCVCDRVAFKLTVCDLEYLRCKLIYHEKWQMHVGMQLPIFIALEPENLR